MAVSVPPRWARRCLLACIAAIFVAAGLPPAGAGASDALFALTTSGHLIGVRADSPGVPSVRRRISGLPGGAVPVALASRPSGELVLAARVGDAIRFFHVDPASGAAAGGPAGAVPVPATAAADIDVEPGGVRLVSSGGVHVLVDPVTGAVTPQPPLRYAAGDANEAVTPKPVGVAASVAGAVSVFDAARGTLASVLGTPGPLADAWLTSLGAAGFRTERRGPLVVSPTTARSFVALSDAGQDQSNLYAAEPTTHLPLYVGPFPDKEPVVGLAVGTGGLLDLDRPVYRVSETDGVARAVVRRSGTISAPAQVGFEVVGESATIGEDLPATAGVIGFGAGQASAPVELPVHEDGVREDLESARIKLTSVGGAAIFGYRRQARIELVDVTARSGAQGTRPGRAPAPAPRPASAATPAPADSRLSVVASAPRVRTIGRRMTVRFRCSRRCRVTVEARLDRRTARRAGRPAYLGRGSRTLTRAGRGTVTIKVARWTKRTRAIRRGTITFRFRGFGEPGTRNVSFSVKSRVKR